MKSLRPLPTKLNAHTWVAEDSLVCVNPAVANHYDADKDKSVF
jgi:hypothetical protein